MNEQERQVVKENLLSILKYHGPQTGSEFLDLMNPEILSFEGFTLRGSLEELVRNKEIIEIRLTFMNNERFNTSVYVSSEVEFTIDIVGGTGNVIAHVTS